MTEREEWLKKKQQQQPPSDPAECCPDPSTKAAKDLANSIRKALQGQLGNLPPGTGGKWFKMLELLEAVGEGGKTCAEISQAERDCQPFMSSPEFMTAYECCMAIAGLLMNPAYDRNLCILLARQTFP